MGCGRRLNTTDSITNITTYYSRSYAEQSHYFDTTCKTESIAFWSPNGVLTASCQSDPWNWPNANTTYVDSVLDVTACTFNLGNHPYNFTTCQGFHLEPSTLSIGTSLWAVCAGIRLWIDASLSK